MMWSSAQSQKGWIVENYKNYECFSERVRELGTTISVATIEVNKSSKARLASAEAMQLHNDHPDADLIAWYCVRQSDQDGASLLIDARDALRGLDSEQRELLAQVEVKVPMPEGPRTESLLSSSRVYYADWLLEKPRTSEVARALIQFQSALEKTQRVRIRLESGDALFIDNRWMMHGRESFSESGSQRLLMRHWISVK